MGKIVIAIGVKDGKPGTNIHAENATPIDMMVALGEIEYAKAEIIVASRKKTLGEKNETKKS